MCIRDRSTGNANLISKALARIKSRWDNASRSYVEKTERLLSDLAAQRITDGYKLSDISENVSAAFECVQDGISFDFKRGQKVVGRGLTAFIGVVANDSTVSITVDESSCRGNGLIGVSLYSDVTLGPGDLTEIFVSLESSRMDSYLRDDLAVSSK